MSFMSAPGKFGAPVTPSDVTDFDQAARALYIGVSGDIVAIMNGLAITFTAVPVGILPIECTRVNRTGTSATDIVALW